VPLHAYHKAILLGFVVYLTVAATLFTLLGHYEGLMRVVQSAEPASYMLLMAFWTWSAWKPEPQLEASPAVMQFLQPWRKPGGSFAFMRFLKPRKV
jgi:threonine/homoserine/homoserine lactone efflux protein